MKKSIQLIVMALCLMAASAKAQCIVNAGSNKSICCPGGTVTLGGTPTGTSSCSGISYVWTPSTGLSNPNVANPVASPSSTTVYTVCMVGYSAPTCTSVCCVACKTVTVSVNSSCCRINPNTTPDGGKNNTGFHVFPIPTNHDINIGIDQALPHGNLTITDVMGKEVLTKSVDSDKPQTITLNVSELPKGIYLVKVKGEKAEELYSSKFVLE